MERPLICYAGIALLLAATLGCGGLVDDETMACTLGSAADCAAHFAERFRDPALTPPERDRGRAVIGAKCEGGDPIACRVYGREIGFDLPDIPGRQAAALAVLKPLCPAVDVEGCFQAARLAIQPGPAQDIAFGFATYEVLCDNGSAAACNNLGRLVETGTGTQVDHPRAFALFGRGCDGGDLNACANHALKAHDGEGIPRDLHQARASFTRACPNSAAPVMGCYNLGVHLRDPKAGLVDEPRGNALIEAACDNDYAPACWRLAKDYYLGEYGRVKDVDRALAMWQATCDADHGRSCHELGYHADHSQPRDAAKALRLFERACALGEANDCRNVTVLDSTQAPAMFARGCMLGDGQSCNEHGVRLTREGDVAAGREAYVRGCSRGFALACRNLGGSRLSLAPKQPDQAKPAYDEGCRLGDAPSCTEAAALAAPP